MLAAVGSPAWAADYDFGLWGETEDGPKLEGTATVTEKDGTVYYDFDGGDHSFIVNGKDAGLTVQAGDKVVINNEGGTLTFSNTNEDWNSYDGGRGIAVRDGADVTINSNLDLYGKGDYVAAGIHMVRGGTGRGAETHLTVNGDVKISGETDNIYGNVDVVGGSSSAPDYTGGRWEPAAILLGEQDGSTITINGDVDIDFRGTGVSTQAYYTADDPYKEAVITLNGGDIRITTPEDPEDPYYSLANYGGTINVNATAEEGALDHKVTLLGNVITMKNPGGKAGGDPYFYQDGQTNIGLTTEDSLWEGVIDNAGSKYAGEVNVWLQNGAVWEHESRSETNGMDVIHMPSPSKDHYGIYNGVSYVNRLTGGSDDSHAGWIYQKDSAGIQIADYSGYTNIVYDHSGDGTDVSDYAAGSVTIGHAAEGSVVNLVTGSSGIDMGDDAQKDRVLNALAQKLIYSAYTSGENNLKGQVTIASGLTSAAEMLYLGSIAFDETTGKGSLSGQGSSVEQTPDIDGSEALTGTEGAYSDYKTEDETGVKYDFGRQNVVITNGSGAALDAQNNITASAAGGSMTFSGKSQLGVGGAVETNGYKVALKAGTVKAVMNAKNDDVAAGIQSGTIGTATDKLTVDGDLELDVSNSKGSAMGIYAQGGAEVHVTGDVKADVKGSLEGKRADLQHYHVNGLYAGFGASKITVDGDVDITTNGTGIQANSGAAVTVKGGGSVTVANEAEGDQYALEAEAATVRMNVTEDNGEVTGAGSGTVKIKGNLGLLNKNDGTSPNDEDQPAEISLGLGAGSELTGVILNEYKAAETGATGSDVAQDVNLYLNGGSWTNEAVGTVKDSFTGSRANVYGGTEENPGFIFQNDENQLTIDQYSGWVTLVYDHTGDGTSYETDYAAGDTKILSAAEGSHITISTSSEGIDVSDKAAVEAAMSALANKLWYMEPEKGLLDAQVQIASGLTSSSQSLWLGDMYFIGGDEGSDTPGGDEDPDTPGGDEDPDTPGGDEQGDFPIKSGVHTYTSDQKWEKTDGTSFIDITKDTTISADGHTIEMTLSSDDTGSVIAVDNTQMRDDRTLNITADKVTVDVSAEKGRAEGIHVQKGETVINGDVDVTSYGKGYSLGAYVANAGKLTINGDFTANISGEGNGTTDYYGNAGLYASGQLGTETSIGAEIIVNGDVDITGKTNGIFANIGDAVITVNGGGTISVEQGDRHYNQTYAAIRAEDSTVNMNVTLEEDGRTVTGSAGNKVNIKGTVAASGGAVNSIDKAGTQTTVNLGLDTEDSTLDGVIYNAFRDTGVTTGDGTKFYGSTNLWLSNGATWTNELTGEAEGGYQPDHGDGTTGTAYGYEGSWVTNLHGGADAAHAGNIIQKDDDTITIENYSGYTNIYYAHTNDGDEATDYAAGDTHIRNAAEDSHVTVWTDSKDIAMGDKTITNGVLNALAGKIWYEAYTEGEKDLTGTVGIASGLTSSALTMDVSGDIVWNETTGQGGCTASSGGDEPGGDEKPDNYGQGQYKPDSAEQTQPGVQTGDFESSFMKGVRSAVTTSALSWRSTASDVFSRTKLIRETGETDGVWAKTYGGRYNYDGGSTSIKNDYWAAQVGYETTNENKWHTGVAVDYRDGSSSYIYGGSGDDTTYSVSAYGIRELDDGAYVDVAAKIGHIENKFDVKNEIGQRLKGKYKTTGYSLSAQYGKRFENGDAYIEPQVQLTYARLNGQNFSAVSEELGTMNVDQKAINSFVGRIGVEAGKESGRGTLFGRLSLSHEFSGDIEAAYSADDGGTKNTSYDLGDTWAELTVGGRWKVSDKTDFYADVTRSFGGDYEEEWKVNAGLKFSF